MNNKLISDSSNINSKMLFAKKLFDNHSGSFVIKLKDEDLKAHNVDEFLV